MSEQNNYSLTDAECARIVEWAAVADGEGLLSDDDRGLVERLGGVEIRGDWVLRGSDAETQRRAWAAEMDAKERESR